jgi:hypothetical protein
LRARGPCSRRRSTRPPGPSGRPPYGDYAARGIIATMPTGGLCRLGTSRPLETATRRGILWWITRHDPASPQAGLTARTEETCRSHIRRIRSSAQRPEPGR